MIFEPYCKIQASHLGLFDPYSLGVQDQEAILTQFSIVEDNPSYRLLDTRQMVLLREAWLITHIEERVVGLCLTLRNSREGN